MEFLKSFYKVVGPEVWKGFAFLSSSKGLEGHEKEKGWQPGTKNRFPKDVAALDIDEALEVMEMLQETLEEKKKALEEKKKALREDKRKKTVEEEKKKKGKDKKREIEDSDSEVEIGKAPSRRAEREQRGVDYSDYPPSHHEMYAFSAIDRLLTPPPEQPNLRGLCGWWSAVLVTLYKPKL